jgi:K+ transporter
VRVDQALPLAQNPASDSGPAVKGWGRAVLTLGALGVVYGDIGTSSRTPCKRFSPWATASASHPYLNVLSVISVLFWTITLVVSVKYVSFVMQAVDPSSTTLTLPHTNTADCGSLSTC